MTSNTTGYFTLACKYLTVELLNTIKKHNSHEKIEATYNIDDVEPAKKTSYKNS